jgi:riboflavin kinase/FMN adenylyltransferase
MKIIEDINLPIKGGCVVITGNFDGVHVGHRQLMQKARQFGAELNLPVLVWTFKKHPGNFVGEHRCISTLSERLSFFEEEGVSMTYLADFEKYRDMSGDEFIDVLANIFCARSVVCGFNFTYGKNKSGNAARLKEKLWELGINSYVMPPVYVDGDIVSSSFIRQCISEGKAEKATRLLGRPYSFMLPVVHGNAYGRTIGVPTANLIFPEWRVVPRFGVYATLCQIDGKQYPSVSNIGIRPTVKEEKKSILCETHILGQSFNLYDRAVRVSLISLLREERKFENFDELVKRVRLDVEAAGNFFELRDYLN